MSKRSPEVDNRNAELMSSEMARVRGKHRTANPEGDAQLAAGGLLNPNPEGTIRGEHGVQTQCPTYPRPTKYATPRSKSVDRVPRGVDSRSRREKRAKYELLDECQG